LKQFLKGHKKLVILGIGNEMRGDDGLGPVMAQKLAPYEKENFTVFDAKTVPENFTGAIKKEAPSHMIILDAVDMNEAPGHIRLVNKEEIANYNISTHAMSLSFLIKYLESTHPVKIILLGIQPKNMDLNRGISPEIQKSMDYIYRLLTSKIIS
jgi:hydrogenase 3 maturation protease